MAEPASDTPTLNARLTNALNAIHRHLDRIADVTDRINARPATGSATAAPAVPEPNRCLSENVEFCDRLAEQLGQLTITIEQIN